MNLKTLLVFVGRSKKVWTLDEMQRHAVLFEYALHDFLSPLEDTSLEVRSDFFSYQLQTEFH